MKPQPLDPWGPTPPCPQPYTWGGLMNLALAEAGKALALGEVPVGAVVVSAQGQILAAGHNLTRSQKDPTAHAEIVVLRKACAKIANFRLNDAYLVVTLEPCLMCVGAIKEARIAGLVYGAADMRAGSVASCMEGFNHSPGPGPWHMGGVESRACTEILQGFFAEKRV